MKTKDGGDIENNLREKKMEDIIDETSLSRSRSNPSSEIVPYQ